MPQRRTAIKELRKRERHVAHNLGIKSDLRKSIKQFLAAVKSKNKDEAKTNLNLVYKKLDKAAKRNIIKKNNASNKKSRFAKLLTAVNS